jgi:hypothetical protein
MRGQGEQIWRSTRGEACLDAGKAVRVSVSVPLTAGFDRLLLALGVVCLAQDGQKGDRGLKAAGNLVNVGRWCRIWLRRLKYQKIAYDSFYQRRGDLL